MSTSTLSNGHAPSLLHPSAPCSVDGTPVGGHAPNAPTALCRATARLDFNELRVSANASLAAPLLSRVAEAATRGEDAIGTLMRALLLRAAQRRGEAPPDDGVGE